jgi:hypothetical protein
VASAVQPRWSVRRKSRNCPDAFALLTAAPRNGWSHADALRTGVLQDRFNTYGPPSVGFIHHRLRVYGGSQPKAVSRVTLQCDSGHGYIARIQLPRWTQWLANIHLRGASIL